MTIAQYYIAINACDLRGLHHLRDVLYALYLKDFPDAPRKP